MLKTLRFFVFCFFHLLTSGVMAQVKKDTVNMHTIDITASKTNQYAAGMYVYQIDSSRMALFRENKLADLIKNNSLVFVKDYGAGGIATASTRGMAATHTGILWNGLSLNSPNLGLCDLSLIPANLVDEIKIYSAGSSAVNGNNALGGLIALNNKPDFNRHLNLGLTATYNDAGNYTTSLNFKTGNKILSSHSQVFYDYNNNRFLFINTAKKGFPEELLNHAKVINYGFVQQLGLKIKNNQLVEAGIWYQVTTRQEPPHMTSNSSVAVLTDSVLRSFLSWKKSWQVISVAASGGYFSETERYNDNRTGIHSTYRVKSYKGDVNGNFKPFKKTEIILGSSVNCYRADIAAYKHPVTDKRISFYTGVLYHPVSSLVFRINLEKTFVQGRNPPVVPSAGIQFNRWNNLLVLKLNTGKQYNLPSLNDKYWQPGGNINLEPETAWSSDAGFTVSPLKKRNLDMTVTAFHILANNWIQWHPVDSTGFYQAVNLKSVQSNGLESRIQYHGKIKQLAIELSCNFSYTRCVNKSSSAVSGTATEGKQLTYVPFYNGNVYAGLEFRGLTFSCQHSFTGKRYTHTDSSDSLPAFDVGFIYIGRNVNLKKCQLLIFIKINNPWNEQYQEVKWHAMPMRNITSGLTFNFNKTKTNKQITQ